MSDGQTSFALPPTFISWRPSVQHLITPFSGKVAAARLQLRVDQARGGLLGPLLGGRLVEEGLRGLLVGLGPRLHARAGEVIDLRAEGVEVDLLLPLEHAVGDTRLDQR